MGRDQSEAPKERVNIRIRPDTGDQQAGEVLPNHLLVLADLSGRPNETPLEERKPVQVDKDNFQQVLGQHNVGVQLRIPNPLSEEKGATMSVDLKFKKTSDFEPEAIANQIPELADLLALRKQLTALKGPMGNVPGFRKAIEAVLKDPTKRAELMKVLGLGEGA